MMRRPRLVAMGLLLLSFAVGGLAGMALEEALGIDWFEFLDEDTDETDDRLLVGLDLSRAQRSEAEDILEREEDRLEAYWESRLPEIDSILRQSYDEIRQILSDEQRVLFDQRLGDLDGRTPDEVRN
jgi:hypothetical protein